VVRRYFKRRHIEAVEAFGLDVVERAIVNYAKVLKSDTHYWSHKWPLWDFIGRANGLPQFVDDMEPLKNFRKSEKAQDWRERAVDESIERALSLE
jgi:hypothetical protein